MGNENKIKSSNGSSPNDAVNKIGSDNKRKLFWLPHKPSDYYSETLIVFVYDTECCKDEADDPVDAVLYFHPSWVSDTQKLALCGQLMGMTYFLKSGLFKPNIIALQNGKFILKEFGRFILAVGTDRNISDSLLTHRSEILSSLIHFFHHDIQTIYDQFSYGGQFKNLSEKLYHIFETFLPILQHKGNIFHNVPKLKIPKSGSNIFLDAIQTLQSCQQKHGVLGGALLYHNKIVATQLSHSATKNLILTDPYRIKSTAEQISVDFHVPNGVQMLVVYIPITDYKKLITESQRAQNLTTQNLISNTLPFQYSTKRGKIKRDKSIIFTNIPEEPASASDISILTENTNATSKNKTSSDTASTISITSNNRSRSNLQRPTHLPLRFKNVTSKEIPESGFVSINFDENDSYPEFIGRTSVCSTPLTENKILQGINMLSICTNPPENIIINDLKENKLKLSNGEESLIQKLSAKIDFEHIFKNIIPNPHKLERRNSLNDIHDSIKKFSKRISIRSFTFGNNDKKNNKNGETVSREDSFDNDDEKSLKTISDPTYPLYNFRGEAISHGLFQEFLEKYNLSFAECSKREENISQLIDNFQNFKNDKIPDNKESKDLLKKDNSSIKFNKDIENSNVLSSKNAKNSMDRKSLTLPLKPLNDLDRLESNTMGLPNYNNSTIFEAKRKKSGIQLTPLMAKLSILAANEESGFSSWDATPGIDIQTPIDGSKLFRRKSSTKMDEIKPINELFVSEEYQKVELYICGQQNMTLFLLLEEGSSRNQELIQTMFDVCVARMGKLENQLNQTLNINVDGDLGEGSYSFICIDPKWDTLHRGGPWTPSDLVALEHMHKDLNMKYPITDLIMRTDESVIYGYKLGITEIFYKESTNQICGLPPPSDLMGTISSRAKRRLERDHSYVLF